MGHSDCPAPPTFLSLFSVPQATYPPAASVVRPPAMLRRPPAQVSSVRQASTQVPPPLPHTQRVGECGQGRDEWGCEEGGARAWCWVGTGGGSGLASTVTLSWALLESSAHWRLCGTGVLVGPGVPQTQLLGPAHSVALLTI